MVCLIARPLVCSAMGVFGVTSSCLGVVVLGCFSTLHHPPATSDRGDFSTRESNDIAFLPFFFARRHTKAKVLVWPMSKRVFAND